MAYLRIPDEGRALADPAAIAAELARFGVAYERWTGERELAPGARAEEVLAAFGPEIERLKARGGYTTADVIDVGPQTPGLDALLAKFSREHRHDEDEVRFVIAGSGLFHLHPERGPVCAVEVEAGDLLCVPCGMRHWFDLCAARAIRCIRLFQDAAGWTPLYTDSGVDARYERACLGPADLPAGLR